MAFDDFGVHRELRARLDQQAHAPAQLLHLQFAFVSLFIEHRRDLGSVAEERADFTLRAAQRKILQRAG